MWSSYWGPLYDLAPLLRNLDYKRGLAMVTFMFLGCCGLVAVVVQVMTER